MVVDVVLATFLKAASTLAEGEPFNPFDPFRLSRGETLLFFDDDEGERARITAAAADAE